LTHSLTLTAISRIPHIRPGDDVARLLLRALDEAGLALQDGDILAVAQKIISKAEGRQVRLADVEPGPRAVELAVQTAKDPRLVELILRESTSVSRLRPGVLIVRHRLGFTSANAGIDRSNVELDGADEEAVLLLPLDPDASAGGCARPSGLNKASRWASSSPTATAAPSGWAQWGWLSASPGCPPSGIGAANRICTGFACNIPMWAGRRDRRRRRAADGPGGRGIAGGAHARVAPSAGRRPGDGFGAADRARPVPVIAFLCRNLLPHLRYSFR
jgi:hypothetical protein